MFVTTLPHPPKPHLVRVSRNTPSAAGERPWPVGPELLPKAPGSADAETTEELTPVRRRLHHPSQWYYCHPPLSAPAIAHSCQPARAPTAS